MTFNPNFFRRSRRDENGMMLFSTVIISLFIFSIILVLAGSTLTMVRGERTNKSFIQADNATKHGALQVRKQLAGGTCTTTGSVPINPSGSGVNEWRRVMGYSWTIYRSSRAQGDFSNPPIIGDADVAQGCPTPTSTWVIMKLRGEDNFGKKRDVAYTYSYHPTTAGTQPRMPYAFLSRGGAINTGRILTSDDPNNIKASLGRMVTPRDNTSSFSCTSAANAGAPATTAHLTLNGDLVSQEPATLKNCAIGGDANVRGRVSVGDSSTSRKIVGGSLCASREVINNIAGNVAGLVRTLTDVCPGSNTSAQMWQDYNPGTSASVPGTTGGAPSGWTRVNLASSNCPGGTTAKSTTFSTYLRGLTTPTILNTSACGNIFDWVGTSSTAQNAQLKTNVTILAPSFDLSYITISSNSSSTARSLNFVTPDTVGNNGGVNERPNCVSPQKDWIIGAANVKTTSPANTFMYSPCGINFSGTAVGSGTSPGIRGQIYSGADSTLPNLRYVPIQLPGATPITVSNPTDGLVPHYPSRVVEG